MIAYFVLGLLLLVILLLLGRAFIDTDPAKLVPFLRATLIALAAAIAAAALVVLAATGRLLPVLVGLGGLVPLLLRGFALWQRQRRAAGPTPGQASEVETDYLRMQLDHDTGAMSGTVRRGPFRGRRLDELDRDQLLALWRDCRVEDEAGASLLEAYLDRLVPDWRSASAGATRAADAMTREEAYAILGLPPGAGEEQIREAHHRLMMKLHPDQGGSTYLAAKLNRAREVLLSG